MSIQEALEKGFLTPEEAERLEKEKQPLQIFSKEEREEIAREHIMADIMLSQS